jgi:hypothetical protein
MKTLSRSIFMIATKANVIKRKKPLFSMIEIMLKQHYKEDELPSLHLGSHIVIRPSHITNHKITLFLKMMKEITLHLLVK